MAVRGQIARIAVAAALAALLALGLVACGGDEDGTSTSADAASQEASQAGDSGAGFQPGPLLVSGGGSEQYLGDGGDGSIPKFGEESDEAELREAAKAVHAFYVARAEGDWAATCARISQPMIEKLENLASETSQRGCAKFLGAFTTPMSDAAWRETTTMDAGSLRVGSEKAFLIYRGADDEVYAMPLRNEEGEWKVEELSAPALS